MNNPNLGRMLRYYRKARNLSVNQVVENLKEEHGMSISPKTVYGWESSQNQPSADTFLILCKMYQINNILESAGYEEATEQAPLVLTEEEQELILKYRSEKHYHSAIRKLLDMGNK